MREGRREYRKKRDYDSEKRMQEERNTREMRLMEMKERRRGESAGRYKLKTDEMEMKEKGE